MDHVDRSESEQDAHAVAFVQGVRIGRSVAAAQYASAGRPTVETGPTVDDECVGDALDALVMWE